MTLAAYAIPVSLAYAGLAGLPPQVGIYGYMLGGLGYALFGSSRELAQCYNSVLRVSQATTGESCLVRIIAIKQASMVDYVH